MESANAAPITMCINSASEEPAEKSIGINLEKMAIIIQSLKFQLVIFTFFFILSYYCIYIDIFP